MLLMHQEEDAIECIWYYKLYLFQIFLLRERFRDCPWGPRKEGPPHSSPQVYSESLAFISVSPKTFHNLSLRTDEIKFMFYGKMRKV